MEKTADSRDGRDGKVTLLGDNAGERRDGFVPDIGFAALVETGGGRVLFDAGMEADHFRRNLTRAGADPRDLDGVVLSHNHSDHTDGLEAVLEGNPDIPVWIHRRWEQGIPFQGRALPPRNRRVAEQPGRQAGLPSNCLISEPLYSGDYGGIWEQALWVALPDGWLLLCGCCHPGLTAFLAAGAGKGRLRILGGMHGFRFSDEKAAELRPRLESLVICHCTEGGPDFFRQFPRVCEQGVLGKTYRYGG